MKRVIVLPSIKIRVFQKVVECITKLEKHYNIKLHRPKLLFEKRGTVAAVANSDNWYININPVLLNENTDDFIENTVPHEVAHLACDRVYPGECDPRAAHGPRWKELMDVLGAKAETFHRYDVTNSRVPRTNTVYRYACSGCNKTFDVGLRRHTRLIANPASFWHTKCGEGVNLRFVDAIVTPPSTPVLLDTEPTLEAYFKIYTRSRDRPRTEIIDSFVQLLHCNKRRAATAYAVCTKQKARTVH